MPSIRLTFLHAGQHDVTDTSRPVKRTCVNVRLFSPPTDVSETESEYEIKLEIAGIRGEDVEAAVGEDQRTVSVSGIRCIPQNADEVRYLNLEIPYGAFRRQIVLPQEVDGASATARCEDGFVIIRLPKIQRDLERRQIMVEQG